MAKADNPNTTNLSSLFVDMFLKEAFRRAERDAPQAFAQPAPKPDILIGGAAERVTENA